VKEIKAQLASDMLKAVFPLNAIDMSRNVLTKNESELLLKLWKNAENATGKPIIPFDVDRTMVASLKYKGYINYDGMLLDFTKRGQEALKEIILGQEENTFEKKAKK